MLSPRASLALLLPALLAIARLEAVAQSRTVTTQGTRTGFDEAARAIQGFSLPKDFKCEVVAADPLLANPVCFSVDEQGRFFVAETFRFEAGVPDIRGRMHWLDTELASKSVAERIAYTRRLDTNNPAWWTNREDRVSLLWDSDGDGQCDKSIVFAGGFNRLEEGIGSGVLARQGTVYYTDIPNLWRLSDTNHDGVADVRESLSSGYGVRYGFLGHDLHGLRIGPDGRLYFSIGDRGAHLELPGGRTLDNSECGAVYRCELDGSRLEIFHLGLRNPQELAFDDFGNLWTCDNNSDAGDPARVVYVAEGGDSGWRVGWQFINQPISRSSWLGERLCYEDFPDRAAYALPPVSSKVGNGPSGLTFDPGVGLPPRWRGRFFLANFSGNPNSGIFAFSVRPKGAGFELDQNERFWWNFLPTDIDFGYDGCIYACDWINGWSGTGKGRIYRLFEPDERARPAVAQTKKLFAEGFEQRPVPELVDLLAHLDRRVRTEAQFALVARDARRELSAIATTGTNLLARLHAIWGLGQLARQGRRAGFKQLLADVQPEVRAQTAKVIGDAADKRFQAELVKLLSDPEARVRYFAALALGKVRYHPGIPPLVTMLRQSAGDPWLRHAGATALAACMAEAELKALATDASVDVRLAAVVALRNKSSTGLGKFLSDKDPRVVAEAARAINDLPVQSALPALAALADHRQTFAALPAGTVAQPSPRDAILRRIVNANFRIGTSAAALRVTALAADEQLPELLRLEAITALGVWPEPPGADHITGLWRPLPPRAAPDFNRLAHALFGVLTNPQPARLQSALLGAAEKLGWSALAAPAASLLHAAADVDVQAAALQFLGAVDYPQFSEALDFADASTSETPRIAAMRWRARRPMNESTLSSFERRLTSGTVHEKQIACELLAGLSDPAADRMLAQQLDQAVAGRNPAEMLLDLLSAAAARNDPQVKQALARFNEQRPDNNGLGQFAECLHGGDAARGQKIFRDKIETSCLRCHKINGDGGEAAPDLTHIAARGDRAYILESITFPSKKIAPGFETVQVALKNGTSQAGIVKSENNDTLELLSAEDGLVTIKKSEIQSRATGLSGMPENLREVLTKHEIRDLVEYLSGLK